MTQEHKFKRALFGGFRRSDVIEYLEEIMSELESIKSLNEELAEKNEALKKSLEESRKYEASAEEPGYLDDYSDLTPDDINNEAQSMLSDLDALLQSYLGGGRDDV